MVVCVEDFITAALGTVDAPRSSTLFCSTMLYPMYERRVVGKRDLLAVSAVAEKLCSCPYHIEHSKLLGLINLVVITTVGRRKLEER